MTPRAFDEIDRARQTVRKQAGTVLADDPQAELDAAIIQAAAAIIDAAVAAVLAGLEAEPPARSGRPARKARPTMTRSRRDATRATVPGDMSD